MLQRYGLCCVLAGLMVMPGIAACALPGSAATAERRPTAQEEKTVRVVAVARHGVRSPTQSAAELAEWSDRPWPEWPVGRGELTPRGGRLIARQWRTLRLEWMRLGLLDSHRCPGPGEIVITADPEQRTRFTALIAATALAPGCDVSVRADAAATRLFHPVRAGDAAVDEGEAAEQVKAALRSLSVGDALAAVQEASGCCAPRLCGRRHGPCTLAEIPARLVFEDGNVHLHGGAAAASSLVEIFVLEYAQWPGRNAGWGRVDAARLQTMLPLRNGVFDALNRAPAAARAKDGALLRAVRSALLHEGPADVVLFVGHDTNIAGLAGLLGLHWDFGEQGRNAVPPGGVLLFSVLEAADGVRRIRASFLGPTLQALHDPEPAAAPFSVDAGLLCKGRPCSPEAFSTLAEQALQGPEAALTPVSVP